MAIGVPRILPIFPNVERLPPSTTHTAAQALAGAQACDLRDVLIVGYDEDGDLVVRSSRMNRADALWLIEKARDWTMGR